MLKSSKKTHNTSPAIGLKRIVAVFAGYSPGTPELSTLLDFNSFLSFFSQSVILHSFTLCLPRENERRRTKRPPPPSASHTTPHQHHVVHVACFAAAARSSSNVGLIEPTSLSDAADAQPSVAMVQIDIGTLYLCGSAEVCRQIRIYVARMAWCGVWRVERVPQYVGIGMGSIGWNYGGPLVG